MVNEQAMQNLIENYIEPVTNKASLAVTPEDMKRFDKNARLPKLIAQRKIKNDLDHSVSATAGYDLIEEMCLISITSIKKTISGKDRPTRTFLYKFAVGLHMNIEEANKFFDLCGGTLREDCPEDYLCIHALLDKDSIYDFCSDYEYYFKKKLTR